MSRLLDDDLYDIVVIDSLVSGTSNHQYLSPRYQLYTSDLCDTKTLADCLSGVDLVIHLAALGNVVESIREPIANFNANVSATLSLLEAMRLSSVPRIIFSSTGGALMGNTPPPVSELSLPKPISPYGASKLSCEGYISAYCSSYGLSSVILRFGNVYGPFSLHKKGVINTWYKLMASDSEISIFGDGSSTRDYIYVTDIVTGIVLAINSLISEPQNASCSTYHLANSQEVSLLSLFEIMSNILGYSKRPSFLPHRSGEVHRNCALSSCAKSSLGFVPSISLKDGLTYTFNWFQSCDL